MARKIENKGELSLQEQAGKILEAAEKKGAQKNFFFVTTFKRYQTQLKIMSDLEKEIEDLGATVSKEYVKGRKNVYTNPAISEYNRTATAANGTVVTLMKILSGMPDEKETSSIGDIMSAIMSDE